MTISDEQFCNTHGMTHDVENSDPDCEFEDGIGQAMTLTHDQREAACDAYLSLPANPGTEGYTRQMIEQDAFNAGWNGRAALSSRPSPAPDEVSGYDCAHPQCDDGEACCCADTHRASRPSPAPDEVSGYDCAHPQCDDGEACCCADTHRASRPSPAPDEVSGYDCAHPQCDDGEACCCADTHRASRPSSTPTPATDEHAELIAEAIEGELIHMNFMGWLLSNGSSPLWAKTTVEAEVARILTPVVVAALEGQGQK